MTFGLNLYSQETKNVYRVESNNEYEWFDNKIGFTYSMMTGYGLTYLRNVNDNFAIKTQLFAYGSIDDEDSYNNYIDFSLGIEFQYTVKKYERTRLYVLGGGYYAYSEENDYYDWNSYSDNKIENDRNVGLGIGFELLAFSNLSFTIDGGYFGRFTKVEEFDDISNIKKISNPIKFGFGFGVSAFYNF